MGHGSWIYRFSWLLLRKVVNLIHSLSQTKSKPYCCVLTQPKTTTVPLQVYSNRYKRALKTGDLSIFQSFLSWLKIKDKTNTDNSALNFEQF